MLHEVKLPKMSEEGEIIATVSFWYANPGDEVKKDEDIVELLTDKAAFNISATADGVLKEVKVNEGDKCKAGDVLAVIEEK